MPLIVDKVFGMLAMPLGTALLLSVLAILVLALKWRRTGMAIIAFSTVWLWIWSMPLVTKTLKAELIEGYLPARLEALPAADAIILLSGDVRPASAIQPYPMLSISGDRAWHAYRLWRAGKAPLIIVSGGVVWPEINDRSAAAILSEFLKDLGVPETAIVREERSRNTRQNARYSAQLADRLGVKTALLVTHTWHMRRALSVFQRTGLKTFPASFDSATTSRIAIMDALPNANALSVGMRWFREYLGRLVYRARG